MELKNINTEELYQKYSAMDTETLEMEMIRAAMKGEKAQRSEDMGLIYEAMATLYVISYVANEK